MAEKVVLFDIENTLIRESKDVSAYFFEAIRNSYGLTLNDLDLSIYEGRTVQEMLLDILEKNGLTKDQVYEKHELFLNELPYAHYNVAGHDRIVLIDGAKDLLGTLHRRGYVMGSASGQLEPILRDMFERAHLNYDSYFKFGTYGDANEHMSKIIETSIDVAHKEFLVEKKNITFISNSKEHVIAAHALGINAIGVVTDASSKKELENLGVGHVVKSLKDAEKFLK